ncbi:MAG: hypothetical protein WCR30_01865 [Clostridia bacterium]
MDRKEKATEILKYYGTGAYSSKIFDEDFSSKTEKVGRWIFKTDFTTFNLSERLVNQILIRSDLRFFDNLIGKFEPADKVRIKTEQQALDVARMIRDRDFLRGPIGYCQNVYKNKKDSVSFDEKVAKYIEILFMHVKYESLGDYGVEYCKSCTEITALGEEEKKFISEFNDTLVKKLFQEKEIKKESKKTCEEKSM